MFEDKKIVIWGNGREGKALCSYFASQGRDVPVIEGKDVDFTGYDVVFKSPGISLYTPCLQRAMQAGVMEFSATNLFMAMRPKTMKTIAVTGTKGKSTTSSLLYYLLKNKGFNVGYGGNIGKPLVQMIGDTYDYFVAELSSYQCADLRYPFDIAVVTNLYPEHIDWHKTHERYYEDKLNLLRVRHAGQKAVINWQNTETLVRTKDMADLLYFNAPNAIHLSDGFVMDGSKPLFETACITNLKGEHNFENICAVLTVLKALGIDLDGIEKDIATFEALPHRLQTVATVQGVQYVDDSISTTPETALAALRAFEACAHHIYLLVGGYDRQQDYSILLDYIRQNALDLVTLITMPVTGKRVAKKAKEEGVSFIETDSVSDAVRTAQAAAVQGDVVLLSPAAPSYHAYKSFEERGADFAAAIEK